MKKKIHKILGVGLTVVLLVSLCAFAAPASAAVLPPINTWAKFAYPPEGSTAPATSGWFWDPDIKWVGPMAEAINGDIYAYVESRGPAFDDIFKSTNGGRSWTISPSTIASYNIVSGNPVVDMVCSELDADILYVTDGNYVYKSVDGGTTFTIVHQADLEQYLMGTCGTPIVGTPITSLDVGYDMDDHPYVFIGVTFTHATSPSAGNPDILYIDELGIGAMWIGLNLDCYGAGPGGYIPYAVAATPDFATSPTKLIAVVSTSDANDDATADDPETHVINSNLGVCGWGEIAELVWDCISTNHFDISHASRIGFPDDYVETLTVFVGVDGSGGVDALGGDVYSAASGPGGGALDRNVVPGLGGCAGQDTDIWSLDICGDTEEASILAGAADDTNVYHSSDGGWTWGASLKDPTGRNTTYVLWAGECGETALASTAQCESAVSMSCGDLMGQFYFNQISLINTCIDCVIYGDFSPGYLTESDTFFMLTACADACVDDGFVTTSLFRYIGDPSLAATTTPDHPWERVYCSAISGAGWQETLMEMVMVSPDFNDTEAVFLANSGTNAFGVGSTAPYEVYRSMDAGCSWTQFAYPCELYTVSAGIVMDSETVIAGGSGTYAGTIFKTTRHGTRPWKQYLATGAGNAMSFDFIGDVVLMGDDSSNVFISEDTGETWFQVDAALDTTGYDTSVALDPGYADNLIIYAAAGSGIYRCVIDPDLLMALQAWAPIYADADSNFWGMAAVGDTALYVGDRDAVDVPGVDTGVEGGMMRSVNADAPSPLLVEFERVSTGLAATTRISGLPATFGINGCPSSNVLWALGLDADCATVFFYEDTLATPVILESPADGAKGLTVEVGTTTATITWEAFCDATSYEKEVWYFCPGCDDKTFLTGYPYCDPCTTLVPCVGCSGETCCEVIEGLTPGVTYYWRIRVCTGHPTLSKWSEERSFTTALTVPTRCSPICGAEDITLTPNFSWTEVAGATSYEVEVSLNEDFDPVIATGTPKVNAWDGVPELEYGTTYYWRVRAVRDGVVGAWTYCLFSTEEAPPEAPAPIWTCPQCGLTFASQAALQAHIDTAHAPPATPLYIWIIIGIGALLVIAVITLIVTTRRVP